jgi:hypothetical protein
VPCEEITNVMDPETQMKNPKKEGACGAKSAPDGKAHEVFKDILRTFSGGETVEKKAKHAHRCAHAICTCVACVILSLLSPIVRISPSSSPFGWHRASILVDLCLLSLSRLLDVVDVAAATKTATDTKLPCL